MRHIRNNCLKRAQMMSSTLGRLVIFAVVVVVILIIIGLISGRIFEILDKIL
ncbi:hypothetical protein JXB41_01495 [Candidatus Woesearchaeota archaeon]|nr:hypothetical protein [Candidatus Woesearchaeota archaeon]